MSILILALWLLVMPVLTGVPVAAGLQKNSFERKSLPFLWISGQIILWAVFQLVCVPFVLAEGTAWAEKNGGTFDMVVRLYSAAAVLLALTGLGMLLWKKRKKKMAVSVVRGYDRTEGRWYYILWAVFWLLLTFQLVQAVRLTYGDGDDAYYVAVATITEECGRLYTKLPYTGGSTTVDIRHGLAPFPVWIAFLARMSGLAPVIMAHVAMPLVLIPMTYGIYYLTGRKICGRKNKEKLPLFMVLMNFLVLFGDYSFNTAERFMIARSRQGKAALGNIVFPMLVLVLLMLTERLQENRRVEKSLWILLAAAVITGCLCSTLGAFLICLLLGATGCCAAVCYKKWKIIFPMILCCIPAVCYAVLYLIWE